MKQFKFIQLLLLILLYAQFAFSQETGEQKKEKAKNAIDKESKFLGDTLIVKQTIKDIEEAINNYDSDLILFFLHDKRKKNKESDASALEKREELSKSFIELDSLYSLKGIENVNHNHNIIFRISNIKLEDNDTIIIANLDMEFAGSSFFYVGNPGIDNVEKKDENKDIKSRKDENTNLIHDTWVFEKVYGQWKLMSCNQLQATIKNTNLLISK